MPLMSPSYVIRQNLTKTQENLIGKTIDACYDRKMNGTHQISRWSLSIPILVLLLLAMMVLPLPPFLLDILFTFNISLSLLVLLGVVYTQRPLNFSVFPTILLLTTLLRLALNIASTRVVLMHGHTGTYAAGQVIHSFGSVVIGSNSAVGLVVFTILVIVNFVVVTKGATRVSEVSARFTLDALPGKQSAIDADLNAGAITKEQARAQRDQIEQEADFYGSMDGASKFVRGDAVAGILILFVNIIGGLFVGLIQHNLSLDQALHNYTLLTIGDGLAAQIPSLLLSTATAIIVTRSNSDQNMSVQLIQQLFDNPTTLTITGLVLLTLGLIPGMPHLPFLLLAMLTFTATFYWKKNAATHSGAPVGQYSSIDAHNTSHDSVTTKRDIDWNDVSTLDNIGLELGVRLIDLVNDPDQPLLTRVTAIRKTLSQEIGFLLPAVNIRDSLELKPNDYRVMIMGVNYGQASVYPDKILAINPGSVDTTLDGIHTIDPTFGLNATWIDTSLKNYAEQLGFTLVKANTVIATHLSRILQFNADSLIGHEEAQQLLDRLATSAPHLTEALVPKALSLSQLVQVLRQLLAEHIPILDVRTIAASLVEAAANTDEVDELVQAVRIGLKRYIVQRLIGTNQEIQVIALDSELEQQLQKSLGTSIKRALQLDPPQQQHFLSQLQKMHQQQMNNGKSSIIVCHQALRTPLSRFIRAHINNMHVLCHTEIPQDIQINTVGQISN